VPYALRAHRDERWDERSLLTHKICGGACSGAAGLSTKAETEAAA